MADPATIGAPLPRVDGIAKVTGTARFPSDVPAERTAHAILITSTIAKGRIRAIDDTAARAVPGFLLLLTHANTQGEVKTPRGFAGGETTTVETPDVMHDGQIVGLVVAETVELARECARRVRFDYAEPVVKENFDRVQQFRFSMSNQF